MSSSFLQFALSGGSALPVRPLLMSAAQLASRLNMSIRTIWRFHSAGKLPDPIRLGRLVRWRRAEIERWVAAGCPQKSVWQAMSNEDERRHDNV
jgi:excisionase family DNA binding protein